MQTGKGRGLQLTWEHGEWSRRSGAETVRWVRRAYAAGLVCSLKQRLSLSTESVGS